MTRALDDVSEHAHQCALFAWATLARKQRPALGLMFAIPNGGQRHIAVAAKLKAEGVKAGVPDICLPWPTQGFGALYIELKSLSGSTSAIQKDWHKRLKVAGNYVAVCRGWLHAKQTIEDYLDGHLTQGAS